MTELPQWNLVADIGGTNARFALQGEISGTLDYVSVFSVVEYPEFSHALDEFIHQVKELKQWSALPSAACLAVACPVDQDQIRFTNSNWTFSVSALKQKLKGIPLDVINDFSAVAYAIPALEEHDSVQIGGSEADSDKPVGILGPGTGLGMCTMVPIQTGYTIIDGEGGHVDFAAQDDLETDILNFLRKRYSRVSIERLLSGMGIVNIYNALCQINSVPVSFNSAREITEAVFKQTDDTAEQALSLFCKILGSTAANLALTNGAKGGIYIAGGITPRILDFLQASEFRERFESKGRFRSYVENIPVRVITKNHLGLFGAMQRVIQLC